MFTTSFAPVCCVCRKGKKKDEFFFCVLDDPATPSIQHQQQTSYVEKLQDGVGLCVRGGGVQGGVVRSRPATQRSNSSSSIINYRLVPPSAHQEPGEMEWMEEAAAIAHPLCALYSIFVWAQSTRLGGRKRGESAAPPLYPLPSPHLIYKRINSPIEN